jgi:hypothetical protein
VLYFATAQVSLLLASGAVALDPRAVAGFFYHARMLAVVHLVTLGWITSSILGALYIVGPMALRTHFPATRWDYAAFACVLIGIIGMVAHFWIEEYGGMAWSAATVEAGVLIVGWRICGRLRHAPLPRAVVGHIVLAFINVAGAATMGVLIGFDKVYHFLPGYVISNVFAHAHLAAIGWASMMVVGVAYRLLPMVLPAEMPSGPSLWVSAGLLEVGAWGLFVALLWQSRFTALFAIVIVFGVAAFLAQVGRMLRHLRSKPAGAVGASGLDPAVLHAGAALAWLVCACGLGVWLAAAQISEASLRVAAAYGTLGLLGFLAQMVVGMKTRLLPTFAWYWAYANGGYRHVPIPPYAMAWRGGQEIVFVLWLFAVPALAAGLAYGAVPFVAAAGWALLAAALLDALNAVRIVRHAFGRKRLPEQLL